MKLDIRAFATASAAAGTLLYAFGALLDRLGAWGAAAIVSFIFRVEVIQLAQPFSFGALLIGLAVCGLLFAALGGIMAWGYNLLARPEPARGTAPVAGPAAGRAV